MEPEAIQNFHKNGYWNHVKFQFYMIPYHNGCPAGKAPLQADLSLTLGWMDNSAPWRDIDKWAMVLVTHFCRQIGEKSPKVAKVGDHLATFSFEFSLRYSFSKINGVHTFVHNSPTTNSISTKKYTAPLQNKTNKMIYDSLSLVSNFFSSRAATISSIT